MDEVKGSGEAGGGGVRATMLRKIRSLILNDACRMRYSGTARQVHFWTSLFTVECLIHTLILRSNWHNNAVMNHFRHNRSQLGEIVVWNWPKVVLGPFAPHLEVSKNIAPKFSNNTWKIMAYHRAKFLADRLLLCRQIQSLTGQTHKVSLTNTL